MLKSLLQKLVSLTAKKGAEGSFPNYDNQVHGSGASADFTYTAPSNGYFFISPRVQRAFKYDLRIITSGDINIVFVGRFSTDETGNTKEYTNFFPMNKGDKVVFDLISGTLVSYDWRFFPAKL